MLMQSEISPYRVRNRADVLLAQATEKRE